jgi:hypothetical protein
MRSKPARKTTAARFDAGQRWYIFKGNSLLKGG